MNSEERNRFAEELLEAVLARYRRAEPLPGIEDRLLARLESTQTSAGSLSVLLSWARRRGVAVGEVCLAMLATIVVMFYLAHNYRSARAPSGAHARKQEMQAANPGRAAVETLVKEEARIEIPSRAKIPSPRAKRLHAELQRQSWHGPRREQFPTPEPLTKQEKLLLSYIRETPAPRPISFHDPEQLKKELEPRPLEALRIEPPKPGGAQ